MKKIYFILTAAALMMFGTPAKAQFGIGEKLYSLGEVTYSPAVLKINAAGIELEYDTVTAVGATYSEVRSLHSELPVYLQYGAGIQYTVAELDLFGDDITLLSAKVPVNAMYEYALPSTNLVLYPYAGLNFQGHISGKSGEYSLFDEDDMGGDPMNRFCLGWQIGARVVSGKYFAGFSYEGPVTHLYNDDEAKIGIAQYNISVGIKF